MICIYVDVYRCIAVSYTHLDVYKRQGLDVVKPGQIIECHLDAVLMNDITFPPARKEFLKIGKPVFDRHKIYLVPDHFTPNKDIQSATQAKVMRDFVREHGITNYFEVGRMGIEHVILPEKGLIGPGEMMIGADSHTCTCLLYTSILKNIHQALKMQLSPFTVMMT